MSFGALFGMAASLAFVLLLLGVSMRVLRRYAVGAGAGRGRLPMEVVERLSLGPRQGIAVVRIGSRLVAVSMGEGGIRPLAELGDEERALLAEPRPAPAPVLPAFLPAGRDFRALLRTALRSAALLGALLLPLGGLAPASAAAQAAPAARQAPAPGTAAAPGPVAAPRVDAPRAAPVAGTNPGSAVGRADTMMARLAPQVDLRVGEAGKGLRLSGTVGVVVMMGLLTLLPTLLLMMTGFTRILIVLHFLRQALGTQNAPPAHLVAGLALLLTGFVKAPTLGEVNRTALQPWMDGRMEQGEMMVAGAKPFRAFMLSQTRDRDLQTFVEMSAAATPRTPDEIPLVVLTSAFVTSELRTAFQIGFALFLPFIVIDVVVSSVLMSMGMFMLPPAMIALPFKLLLFV
ncbi:MAG TPA: flagellar type III secretion system pore protein FliP, partial [Longimicrobiaceae bacterium]